MSKGPKGTPKIKIDRIKTRFKEHSNEKNAIAILEDRRLIVNILFHRQDFSNLLILRIIICLNSITFTTVEIL